MREVYMARKGNQVVYHTDKQAMQDMDGVVPEKTVSLAEWEAAGGLVRILEGKIVLGKTPQEQEAEKAAERIAAIDERFEEITKKMVRPMLAHIKGAAAPEDTEKLNALEAEAQSLRTERAQQVLAAALPY